MRIAVITIKNCKECPFRLQHRTGPAIAFGSGCSGLGMLRDTCPILERPIPTTGIPPDCPYILIDDKKDE